MFAGTRATIGRAIHFTLLCGSSEIKVSNYSMLYEVPVVTIMEVVVFWYVIGR